MFKKILLTLLVSFQGIYAFTLITPPRLTSYLKIDSKFKNEGQKDWIGVYKKGSSVAWENVIEWEWVNTLPENGTKYSLSKLVPNDYVVRYFKDNTFVVSDEYDLHLDEEFRPSEWKKIKEYPNGNVDLLLHTEITEKDWIAYYKQGTSTDWENVLKWYWVEDLKSDGPSGHPDTVPLVDFAPGNYEVRYFKNNSFKIANKPFSFTIKEVNSTLSSITGGSTPGLSVLAIDLDGIGTVLKPNPKDWIGLYNPDSSNEWGNVIRWIWVTDIIGHKAAQTHYEIPNIKPGKYELRYFLNNSFTTHKKSEPFSIK